MDQYKHVHNKHHTAWTRPFTSHIKGYKQPHMLIYCHASHHFIDAYGANTWYYRPWRYNSYWARRASWEFTLIWVQKSLQNWINCAHVKGGSDHKGSLLRRISSRFEKHSRKNVARSNQRLLQDVLPTRVFPAMVVLKDLPSLLEGGMHVICLKGTMEDRLTYTKCKLNSHLPCTV